MAPKTIVDEWSSVQAPPPPQLNPATVDPKTTAYLVMDILTGTCNIRVRPRCVATVPSITTLLARESSARMLVIYTHLPGTTADNILPQVRPFLDNR